MLTLFSFDANSLASTTAYIGIVFSDAGLVVALAIGIPLAFYVIKKVIGLVFREPRGYPYEDYLKEK